MPIEHALLRSPHKKIHCSTDLYAYVRNPYLNIQEMKETLLWKLRNSV